MAQPAYSEQLAAEWADDGQVVQQPRSLQAEEAVLGSVLKEPACIAQVADMLQPGDFYSNGQTWAAMLALHHDDVPIDLHTLGDKLQSMGLYDKAGGMAYLSALNLATPTAANIRHYAGIVVEKALQRRLIKETAGTQEVVYSGRQPIELVLGEHLARVEALRMRQAFNAPPTTAAMAAEYYTARLAMAADPGLARAMNTGLADLDRMCPFRPQRYILLGGRTGKGKSVLMLQWALYHAQHYGPTVYYTLEMSVDQIMDRCFAMLAHLSRDKVQDPGSMDEDELARFTQAKERLAQLPIYFRFECTTTDAIRADSGRLEAEVGRLAAIYVDYVQKLQDSTGHRNGSRHEDLGQASAALARLAKRHDCPVIAAAQLSRELEKRRRGIPRLSDFRDSGNLEQDADQVLALTRAEVHRELQEDDEPDQEYDGTAQLVKLKDRDSASSGRRGNTVRIVWRADDGEMYANFAGAGRRRKTAAPNTTELPFDAGDAAPQPPVQPTAAQPAHKPRKVAPATRPAQADQPPVQYTSEGTQVDEDGALVF